MLTTNHTKRCLIAGAVLGGLVWAFVTGPGPLGALEGLFLGLITAGLTGAFLNWLVCSGPMAETGERDFQSLVGAHNAGALDIPEKNTEDAAINQLPDSENQGVITPSGDAQFQVGYASGTVQGGPF